MANLWSDDFVVTNPLNKFVNKQQVLEMVRSGLLSDHFLRSAGLSTSMSMATP